MDNKNILQFITNKGKTSMNELEEQFTGSSTQLKEDLQILMQTRAIGMDADGKIYRI